MAKKILGICGSLRADSWNLKLLRAFLSNMKDSEIYPNLEMPLLNEDLELRPLDARIINFRSALKNASIIAIASPEYNGSFSSALKNAIDWATREENIWAGKTVVLLGASPGAFGAVRGAIMLKTVLSGLKSWVIPEQVLCPNADKAFDSNGQLINEAVKKQIALAKDALSAFEKSIT